MYLLASSLAAALLNGLFEHPAEYLGTITLRIITAACRTKTEFIRKLLVTATECSGVEEGDLAGCGKK